MTDATLSPQATALVAEFRQIPGLSEADCYKSAFAVFALRRGWSKAKIGRHLGITRARVGQKIQKCEEYAKRDNMPVLVDLLEQVAREKVAETDSPTGFTKKDWDNPVFAVGMVNMVA